MTALKKIEPAGEVANYGASLLEVISRAASDPSVDIDKMERLIAMQERVQDRQAASDFADALSAMQTELPVITKGNQIKHGEKVIANYADWDSISKAITPILSKHGFSLNFRNSNTANEITVTAVLRRGGHEETNSVTLPSDSSGSKNAVQAIGSSTLYGQRYAACPLVGVTIQGADDDGAKAGMKHPISVKQYDELLRKISEVAADQDAFVEYLKSQKRLATDDLGDLPAQHFQAAINALNAKVKK